MQRLSSVALLLAAGLGACHHPGPTPQAEAEACREAQKSLDRAEESFVARAREIRRQHILLVEYDRQMIAALTTYRDQIRATLDAGEAVGGTRWRCTGKPLANLKLDQQPKLQRVQGYLVTFERALQQDPPNVYVQ
jgi:hypothetical protein